MYVPYYKIWQVLRKKTSWVFSFQEYANLSVSVCVFVYSEKHYYHWKHLASFSLTD